MSVSSNSVKISSGKMPYMSDPTIVPRVQKYLEANVDKTYIDINEMADHLQGQYRDYSKRKRSAFRASVNKAYSIVLASYGMNEDNSDGDTVNSDDSIDPGDNTHEQLNNSMNNQMLALYHRKHPQKSLDENELIDISSDDDEATSGPVQDKKVPSKNGTELTITAEPNIDHTERGKKRKMTYATVMKFTPNKKKKTTHSAKDLTLRFKDIGGMDKTLEEVCKLLIHISHPEIYKSIGITPPRGFLLHGPPGCGKTLLANAIAGELNVPLVKVAAPELVAGVSGESEARIRELFEQAVRLSPCVLFIDEIDAITQNRQNAQKEMEKRIVAQLLSCLDELNKEELGSRVLVIGATNRPDSIDSALRRAGRFDREISLGIPNKESRAQILKVLTAKLKLAEEFDFDQLAALTPGYVGADLLALSREAAMVAVSGLMKRIKEMDQKEEDENNAAAIAAASVTKSNIAAKKTPPEEVIVEDVEIESVEDSVTESKTAPKKVSEPEVIIDDVEIRLEEPTAEELTPVVDAPVAVDKPADVVAAEVTKPSNIDTSDTVVIIDDDNVNKAPVAKASRVIPEPNQKREVPKWKALSALDEILAWLHDQLPLSAEELTGLCITMEDFKQALEVVQPSAKREGFITVPDTTWDDVGSLKNIREELQLSIVAPVKHAAHFESLGIDVPTGVLLFGPPGCGKTLLAKAIANEAGINFISVKGPELLNMYVGESERAVRVCFERARNSAPCVIFFDELDALCSKRGGLEAGSTGRVVNQLLTEMDGVGGRKGVYLLAATNRPDIIDPAILRPGRLDKLLYVGLPLAADRAEILRAVTRNGTRPKLAADVSLDSVAESEECAGFTGADLAALVREAGVAALRDVLGGANVTTTDLMVTSEHFKRAFRKIRGSVSEKNREYYENLRKQYSSDRKDSEVEAMELS